MQTNVTWNKEKCFIHYQNLSTKKKKEKKRKEITTIVLILKTNIKTKVST